MAKKQQIFRQKSLDKLASPDRLDQMLHVVKPQSWIILWTFGGGLAVALAWSILGSIPVTVTGAAILVRPKQVVSVQSPSNGTIAEILVDVGDRITKGDVLATLRLPDLQKELDEERDKLAQFQERSRELAELEQRVADDEGRFIQQRRELLKERIAGIRETAASIKQTKDGYIAQQKVNVSEASVLTQRNVDDLKELLEGYEEQKDQIISRSRVIEARARATDNELRVAELKVKAEELKLDEILAEESYTQKQDLIRDLEIQLQDLELQEMQIQRRLRERELNDAGEEQSIQRSIALLDARLKNSSQVLSEFDGHVLEITTSPGQLVAIGNRIGKIEIVNPTTKLQAVAYFEVKDGKKIRNGLAMRVAPSTVQRERYGSIVGSVRSVSDYPVTTEAAANQIGDLEIARNLLRGENRIEVIAELETDDSYTGYKWTSGVGPEDLTVTAGTTAEVRVTIEEQPPITLVFPFLRSMTGR